MKIIKYHQYGYGTEYGPDHSLTNNWNPDLDYGNEYVNVYFNIDTPTYDYNCGFYSEKDRTNWYTEIKKLIASFGILEDSGFTVENSNEKCAYLYAHPQQISGVILKNDVKKIAESISKMVLSSLRWVDLYETVYVMTDDIYEHYLNSRDVEIERELFKSCHTSRKTNYLYAYDVCRTVADKFRLRRLGINDGKNYGSGQTIEHIMKLIYEMADNGLVVIYDSPNNGKYVRSINKTEQKKLKSKKMLNMVL